MIDLINTVSSQTDFADEIFGMLSAPQCTPDPSHNINAPKSPLNPVLSPGSRSPVPRFIQGKIIRVPTSPPVAVPTNGNEVSYRVKFSGCDEKKRRNGTSASVDGWMYRRRSSNKVRIAVTTFKICLLLRWKWGSFCLFYRFTPSLLGLFRVKCECCRIRTKFIPSWTVLNSSLLLKTVIFISSSNSHRSEKGGLELVVLTLWCLPCFILEIFW